MGFEHDTPPFVFQTDSDRQHVPAEFWKACKLAESADFIFGMRPRRADGAVRVIITRCMQVVNLAVWSLWIADANCPFKLMRRDAFDRVLSRIPRDSFIPMVMVSIVARKMGFQVREVPVTHLPRNGGTQSLRGMVKWVRVGSRCALQILSIRRSFGAA